MSKVSRRTVDIGTSLVADGMGAKTLQFWPTQVDHSRPVSQPLVAERRPVRQRDNQCVSVSAHRRRLLARYDGAVPWRQRYDNTHNRNWIRSGIRSQWSSRSSGVVWSDRLAEKISRAAAFRTDSAELVTGNTGQDGAAVVNQSVYYNCSRICWKITIN